MQELPKAPFGTGRRPARLCISGFASNEKPTQQARMKVFRNRSFRFRTVKLDDHHYDNCRFESCVFVYAGTANFSLTNSLIDEDCGFRLDGVAAKTMKAMQALYSNSEWGRQMILNSLQDVVPALEKRH